MVEEIAHEKVIAFDIYPDIGGYLVRYIIVLVTVKLIFGMVKIFKEGKSLHVA